MGSSRPGRRQARADRIRIALAASIAAIVLLAVALAPVFPMVIFGKHGSSVYLFKPLSQVEPDLVFMHVRNHREWGHFNWDEPWLFIDGHCGCCGKPYAPEGTFIVALLPEGLGATWRDSGKYDHMTTPSYLSGWVVLFVGVSMPVVVAFSPMRRWRRKRQGLCLDCGYNLTGNESGTCPECGKSIVQEGAG